MTSPAKAKGDRAERELAQLLTDLLGRTVRRRLGAGRKDDEGDLDGLPETVIQVTDRADLDRAIREKLPDVERQMANAKARFGALFCRRRGGRYVVVMTLDQWTAMWDALPSRWEFANGTFLVHRYWACKGYFCALHNPSDHPMREWPMHYRLSSQLIERICPHGVGHPDPDSVAHLSRTDPNCYAHLDVHGCDGCCGVGKGSEWRPLDRRT